MLCNLNHVTTLLRTCTSSIYKELFNKEPKIGLVRLIGLILQINHL